MADTMISSPVSVGSAANGRIVTMSGTRTPSAGSHHSSNLRRSVTPGSGKDLPSTPDYMQPIVRSAVRRWKRLHEQNMMDRLVDLRNEKKYNLKASKEDARKIARKIPTEVLAKEWLQDNQATVEVRAYLVDKVFPTLILGVEKLLQEADKKGLAEVEKMEPNFNPLNFLAQYLLRNNPRYSNFSEASPYVRGLREVAEELRKQLFTIEDNRLARIKAEAKRKREERERLQMIRDQERQRRQFALMKHFQEWNVTGDGRVELSLLQNALRSFVEMTEQYPEELREAARFGHPLEATDESGRVLIVKEFTQYLSLFVEILPTEIFDEFLIHMRKCASAHLAASERESRRIVLTNLFMACDHSGIGILDRHRILNLFESFWDTTKDEIKIGLRNPRKWPVVEVDEADDSLSDEEMEEDLEESGQKEEHTPEEKKEEKNQEETKQEEETKDADQQKTEADSDGLKEAEEGERQKEEELDEQKQPEGEQKQPAEDEQKDSANEISGQKDVKVDGENEEVAKEEEEKTDKEKDDREEQKADMTTEDTTEKEEKKEGSTTDDGEKKDTPEEVQASEGEEKKKDGEKVVEEEEKGEQTEGDQGVVSEKEQETQSVAEKDEDEAAQGSGEIETVDLKDSSNKNGEDESQQTAAQTGRMSVTFAKGTAFDREKTEATQKSRSHSQLSAFDENTLNVSQFVQLTETFIGDKPKKLVFDTLLKYVKEGYEETEDEKMDRLIKARKEAISAKRKKLIDSLFEKWDNDGSGFLDLDEVETVMQKYKEGQEVEAINKAKEEMKKKSKYHDQRLSKREFRNFIQLVVEEIPGGDTFEYFIEFLTNSVERSYADRVRGEARKKWLQQIITAAETAGASMEPVYRAVFQALYKDAEAHGGGKKISSNISMLERNVQQPERGDLLLRYVASTLEDADYVLGKTLFKDQKGISFASVESGKPIHVPRVANHGNIHFWNTHRRSNEREGSFIIIPLKDRKKRVFGLLGIDTLNDPHTKAIFITHEIQYFQGVAKAFSIAYHHVDMRKKLLRITESAVAWIQRRSPHVREIIVYMVEPDAKGTDYVLRKMMVTDPKGSPFQLENPPRLERKDNLFRDYLFKSVDNSESVTADAYGERHLAFPLRDDQGHAIAIIDISIGDMKKLPPHENKETQRMLRILQQAHKEITKEFAGGETTRVLDAEKDDDTRMDIMFDRLMLMELRENVSKLDNQAYAELRSYYEPPKIIHDILKATCAIFYLDRAKEGEFDDWNKVKTYINIDLSQKITGYDPTAQSELFPPEQIEVYMKDVPHGEVAKHGSLPAQHMYNWVFVCLSLIEHTRKMRENTSEDNVATTTATEGTLSQDDQTIN